MRSSLCQRARPSAEPCSCPARIWVCNDVGAHGQKKCHSCLTSDSTCSWSNPGASIARIWCQVVPSAQPAGLFCVPRRHASAVRKLCCVSLGFGLARAPLLLQLTSFRQMCAHAGSSTQRTQRSRMQPHLRSSVKTTPSGTLWLCSC